MLTRLGYTFLIATSVAVSAITNVSVRATHRQAVISYTAPDATACSVEVYSSDLRVTAATNTTPIAITVHRPHSLETGDEVYISGVLGNTNANGYHTVTVTADAAFTLDGVAGNGAYISGGLVQRLVHDVNPRIFGTGVNLDSRTGSVSNLRHRTFVVGQIPLPGWAGYAPVEVTSVPMSIASVSRTSNVATVNTMSPHGLRTNDNVAITGVTDVSFEVADARVVSVVDADTFTYASAGGDGSSTGGTVTRVNRYSRTLQADAEHRFRISCGAQKYEGVFRTRTVPGGSTYGETLPFDWASAPMRYMEPSLPDQRGYEVVDPVTGVMALRVSLVNDGSDPNVVSPSAGSMNGCALEKTNTAIGGAPGYHCVIPTRGSTNRWYWLGEDGTIRFLGEPRVGTTPESETFYVGFQIAPDPHDPNSIYVTYPIKGTLKPGLGRVTLNSDAAVAQAAFANETLTALTPLAAGKNLADLIHDFDNSFPISTFAGINLTGVQGNYLTGVARAYQQDSPAWLWALYLGDGLPLGKCTDCLRVVAAMPMYAHPKMRWCGYHYGNLITPEHAAHVIVQGLVGAGGTGPWTVALENASGVDASEQSFTVSGEPTCTGGVCPPDGSTYLQDAAVGDTFLFMDGTNERVKITAKNGNTWTVQRAYTGTAVTHARGAAMFAACTIPGIPGGDPMNDFFWKYLSDPHGTDMSNTALIQDRNLYNVHRVDQGDWSIAGWSVRKGTDYTGPATYTIPKAPAYNGIIGFAFGNSYQSHPAYTNWPAADNNDWFSDGLPFIGSLPGVVTKVPEATYLYRVAPGSYDSPKNTKLAPYFGISATNPLLDISGPDALLNDTPADAYKFCAVYEAGECWPGSTRGEFYANVPNLGYLRCSGGEYETSNADLCAAHTAAYGQAAVQLGIGADGVQRTRVLIRGLAGPYRGWGSYTSSRATPDGKWLLLTPRDDLDKGGLLEALIPRFATKDDVNRAAYVPFPVRLGGHSGGKRTIVEFGYDPDLQWRCTQRAEGCVADSADYDTGSPFKYATADTVSGADCTEGCTITVPAISDRVLYYRWKYRDAGGSVLATGPVQVAVVTP